MLSNPLQRFSQYHSVPSSTMLSGGHVPSSHMHNTALNGLAPASHYAFEHLEQHIGSQRPHLTREGPPSKHRQHPYGSNGRATGTSSPVRRRISRACDQCNQLRTKCDGQHPCAHCIGKSESQPWWLCLLTMDGDVPRVRARLRVSAGEEEERQSITQRSGSTGCCPSGGGSSKRRQVADLTRWYSETQRTIQLQIRILPGQQRQSAKRSGR